MKNADLLFMQFREKVPTNAALPLKESLDKASESKLEGLAFLPLKNPTLGLIFSILLSPFGVDRFYKGDIGLGVLKVLLFWGSYFLVIVSVFYTGAQIEQADAVQEELSYMLLPMFGGLILLLVAVIWMFADIFFVYTGIKKDNLQKIYLFLNA